MDHAGLQVQQIPCPKSKDTLCDPFTFDTSQDEPQIKYGQMSEATKRPKAIVKNYIIDMT